MKQTTKLLLLIPVYRTNFGERGSFELQYNYIYLFSFNYICSISSSSYASALRLRKIYSAIE